LNAESQKFHYSPPISWGEPLSKPFYEQPVLNSPYLVPTRHHALDADGRPLDQPPIEGRRRCGYVVPVPTARRQQRDGGAQAALDLDTEVDAAGQAYGVARIVDEIRQHLATWRNIPNPDDWGVTPSTARLLAHWRDPPGEALRPFFCQVEAVETIIWLTEVARGKGRASILKHLEAVNAEANPDLFRLAMKMATGSGKTTVMAMLIAWHTVNAVRSPNSKHFSRGFLIVTPGITIRDRLRVLNPADPDNYYTSRHLVPMDVVPELGKAKIVITNYHAFGHRRTTETNKVGEAALSGWRNEKVITEETDGEMLKRACDDLLALKHIVVLNDEAHHCYRERPACGGGEGDAKEKQEKQEKQEKEKLTADERQESKDNTEAARLWISGIEALKRKVGLRAVYDLSATPFFLRGSGYEEGTLFPWVVSDFALIDAIECGIVKLPRVPVSDNAVNAKLPVFRNLWDHIGKAMSKKGSAKAGEQNPLQIPNELQTALYALYSHYQEESKEWKQAGVAVPPVFIVVCNNTANSKLIYEWISGWEREFDGVRRTIHRGHLALFSNYDQEGNALSRMNTLLIDSRQIESGEAIDPAFRKAAEAEIDQFRREKAQRDGAAAVQAVSDEDLLREVMNTVGKEGRLGEKIRCVVSVSMLTEGWDANTVTHILGVRAFGTQLLCEQVIGRALRRLSYETGDNRDPAGNRLLNAEYADILGIPFEFASEAVRIQKTPPKPVTRVFAVKARASLAIRFPRVAGYRTELPGDRFDARFTADSKFVVDPALVGPSKARLEGVVGEGIDIAPDTLDEMRESTVALHLSKRLVERYFVEGDAMTPYHLVGKLQPITRRWLNECVQYKGGTKPGMLTYLDVAERAIDLIYVAIARHAGERGASVVKAILDPFNPAGATDYVSFVTTKENPHHTRPDRCHINIVVCDSGWEAEFARVAEGHPAVVSYVKNQGLGFEVPLNKKTASGVQAEDKALEFTVPVRDGAALSGELQRQASQILLREVPERH
jgi:type III restriction enzyme